MTSLSTLRSRLTEIQQTILDKIWGYYISENTWIRTSTLLIDLEETFEHDAVISGINSLGGSIVYEQDQNADSHRYYLTSIGALLTCEGSRLEELVCRLLLLWQTKLRQGGEAEVRVSNQEAENYLTIDEVESKKLYKFLGLGTFYPSGSKERWDITLPYYLVNELDLAKETADIYRLFEKHVLLNYDPTMPVLASKKLSHSYAQNVNKSVTKVFSFVADAKLQDLLESDWEEIQALIAAKAWKSCIILCGSILEGTLWDALSRDVAKANNAYFAKYARRPPAIIGEWRLVELVEVGKSLNILPPAMFHLGHAVREFRNLVHPGKQIREKIEVTQEQAAVAVNLVKMCIDSFS